MLPGFSSKNHQIGGGNKNLKSKKHSHNDGDDSNEWNEILLHYSLERMNDQQHDFSHCDTHRDAYPFASSLSKNTEDDLLFEQRYDEDEDHSGGGESIEIQICTYQINTSCKVPFIEYLITLSHDKSGKQAFEFPKFNYVSSKRKSTEKQSEEHILKTLMYH